MLNAALVRSSRILLSRITCADRTREASPCSTQALSQHRHSNRINFIPGRVYVHRRNRASHHHHHTHFQPQREEQVSFLFSILEAAMKDSLFQLIERGKENEVENDTIKLPVALPHLAVEALIIHCRSKNGGW